MRRIRLDRIDRRILRNLLTTGERPMSNSQSGSVFACVGHAPSKKPGLSTVITPTLHLRLGYGVTVFAQVGLSSQAEPDLKAFEELVATWPEVRETYMLAGETDFLLKIITPDWDSY